MTENSRAIELTSVCHRLARMGWGTSTSGNVSARDGERILLTPTGVAMADVAAEELAVTDLEGNTLGHRKPTKEMGFHLAIFRQRSEVQAIVHVHPTHAIVASTFLDSSRGETLPAVTPQFVMRAGLVPVLPYYPPGSEELTQTVATNVGRYRAVVLQNHGVIAFGETFAQVMGILEELEENCRQWLFVRHGGRVLSSEEVQLLLGRKM